MSIRQESDEWLVVDDHTLRLHSVRRGLRVRDDEPCIVRLPGKIGRQYEMGSKSTSCFSWPRRASKASNIRPAVRNHPWTQAVTAMAKVTLTGRAAEEPRIDSGWLRFHCRAAFHARCNSPT
eukprot:1570893-Amphidinium_carterae.1